MIRSLTLKANEPPPTPPQCILISRAVDIGGMRGCHRKLWENVWEAIVKNKKIQIQSQIHGKDKDKNVGK